MKRKSNIINSILIGIIIVAAISLGVLVFTFVIPKQGSDGEVPDHWSTIDWSKIPQVDYPFGDETPEHLATILGSEEEYQKLLNSKLLAPVLNEDGESEPYHMYVSYDVGSIGQPNEKKIPWVAVGMMGEVIDISLSERIVTIANEGEQISFQVWAHAIFMFFEPQEVGLPMSRNGSFDEIEIGDFIDPVVIFINVTNLDLPQARGIMIDRYALLP